MEVIYYRRLGRKVATASRRRLPPGCAGCC